KYKGIVGTKPRTVMAWIKTTRARGQVISWGLEDGGKMFTFCFIGNRARIGISPRGGYYYMNDQVHNDQWHHVAAVIKEAELPNLHDDAVLYLDGVIAEIHDIGLLDLWPIDTGSDLDVTIGDGFKGLIDDVRIYDRALSDDEMMALFKLQSDRPLPKPKK
ncbi:MAG: LamG domain-containing protein, partial [Planctomycetota bacterium]